MSTYTHEELVGKLEAAQLEIIRLKSRPDHSTVIKQLRGEILSLREHVADLVKQRNDLFAIVKRYESGKI